MLQGRSDALVLHLGTTHLPPSAGIFVDRLWQKQEDQLRLEASDVLVSLELQRTQNTKTFTSTDSQNESVHTEQTEPGICKIGRVRSVDDGSVKLIALDPDADWDDEVTEVPLADVTRVDIGGAYEEALLLVGGPCPVPILRAVD